MDCMVNVNGSLRTAKILSIASTPQTSKVKVQIAEEVQEVPLSRVFYEPSDLQKALDLFW